jgi:hypothetical protein
MTSFVFTLIDGLIQVIAVLVRLIQPILVPLCFVLAWGLLILTAWGIWSATRDGLAKAKQMHEIPCANCRFFTNDYHLKCPVHPSEALSEAAIGCPDFEPAVPSFAETGSRSDR